MKLKFKQQAYQTEAVLAIRDCFTGQPPGQGLKYAIDPGRPAKDGQEVMSEVLGTGFANPALAISQAKILENIHEVQRRGELPISTALETTSVCDLNLDIEMETGTGKTYCYIKTMFELHKVYGWSKFIIVVPSIAIREGVAKSFEIMAEHFLADYGKRIRSFIYHSKQLHNLESFSSDAGINVMIINIQAFNAKGEDARRIDMELDDFQSRKPIDVIAKNRPILILDEPQKMEGPGTVAKLVKFKPLMILRYSATHKKEHNKVYRLDALDAYNQKLVKKIAVRGISVKGLSGTGSYLLLKGIDISPSSPPKARIELEIKHKTGIKREIRVVEKGRNLHDLSEGLDQYAGFVVSEIDARDNGVVSFTNGTALEVGKAAGDVNESALRRIQIREAIKAHFEKERLLFAKGIKVLTLFFIDEVAKYRSYNDAGEQAGEYAQMFEEEYNVQVNELLTLEDTPYNCYLKGILAAKTHNGYFSIDKKTKRLVNPDAKKTGETAGETDDVDAYDLILKDKERLLTFEEPVRFIFSHSALREGWDNSNVFVICTLKHSDNVISRRQEVGRGMRLCRDQSGDRIDDPALVHQINVLTVVANESYRDFVSGLQKDLSASLSARTQKANEEYFRDKVLKTPEGDVKVTPQMAKLIERYLVKNDYTDTQDRVTEAYHQAAKDGTVASLPAELEPYREQILQLVNTVFRAGQLPEIEDELKAKTNPLNANFKKKEFQELWSRINRKAVYAVDFQTDELVVKCIKNLDEELKVAPLQYTVTAGEQKAEAVYEEVKKGESFETNSNRTENLTTSAGSGVRYDLIGKLSEATQLTRRTITRILQGISAPRFGQYRTNPENFLMEAARLINEQKATVIIEHLTYDTTEDRHDIDIFTKINKQDLSKGFKSTRHIYDYVFTDSGVERTFAGELDASSEVVVYAKLPKSFNIPTPVGNYNPDWAIAFHAGKVKHIYFVAETKGSMSSMELREIEKLRIACARKFFAKITSDQVKYDVVNSYGKLMQLVK
ncbi:MAG: DEAD/DEAH box helicase family protein [Verrucomicrobiota bacterium]